MHAMANKEGDTSPEAIIEETMSLNDTLTRVVRKAWRPKIHKLVDAIVDGEFMVQPGQRVIIQYPEEANRDTTNWIVKRVFETVDSDEFTVRPGHVRLWDPEKTQYGCTNYKDAEKCGLVMKVPDSSRRWTPGETETLMELAKKHRRKRKKKEDGSEPEEKKSPREAISAVATPTSESSKRRGRPPGTKNKKKA